MRLFKDQIAAAKSKVQAEEGYTYLECKVDVFMVAMRRPSGRARSRPRARVRWVWFVVYGAGIVVSRSNLDTAHGSHVSKCAS